MGREKVPIVLAHSVSSNGLKLFDHCYTYTTTSILHKSLSVQALASAHAKCMLSSIIFYGQCGHSAGCRFNKTRTQRSAYVDNSCIQPRFIAEVCILDCLGCICAFTLFMFLVFLCLLCLDNCRINLRESLGMFFCLCLDQNEPLWS